MTNQKKGLAGYDNDPQRRVAGQGDKGMQEKGSQMERGTSHEFSTEQISDSGVKNLKSDDPAPGGDPENVDSAGQGRVEGKPVAPRKTN